MTICAPNSGKWSALVEAMTHIDKPGGIFEIFMGLEESKYEGMFIKQVLRQTKWQESIIEKSFPYLGLNGSLPNILNLLDIEKEVFYLIHFACFFKGPDCKNDITLPLSQKAMLSILGKKSRQETAAELKQSICQKVDCHFTNSKTWMNCIDKEFEAIDESTDYHEWCKKCNGYQPQNSFVWVSFSLLPQSEIY